MVSVYLLPWMTLLWLFRPPVPETGHYRQEFSNGCANQADPRAVGTEVQRASTSGCRCSPSVSAAASEKIESGAAIGSNLCTDDPRDRSLTQTSIDVEIGDGAGCTCSHSRGATPYRVSRRRIVFGISFQSPARELLTFEHHQLKAMFLRQLLSVVALVRF